MRYVRLFSLALAAALLLLASAGAQAGPRDSGAKLDPLLRLLLARNEQSLRQTGAPLDLRQFAGQMAVYAGDRPVAPVPQAGGIPRPALAPDRLGVLITLEGSPRALERAGVQPGTVAGSVVTARLTLDQLRTVAALPEVVRIGASRRLNPLGITAPGPTGENVAFPGLDVSVPETGAASLHSQGISGSGVIVGVVDTGIDWRHADFRTGGAGEPNSRILYLWDQADTAGPPPPSFAYGSEWTQANIETDLADPSCPPACAVRERDSDGHGTHVTGIAAGDGSSSAGGYVGMAPQADIIGVATTFLEGDIVDGVSYVFQKASALGKPAVVNLSLGSDYGPHDGTTAFEQALDALVGGAGKVIVAAAGNSASIPSHAGGTVPAAGALEISFLRSDTASAGGDFWYDGASNLCLTVRSPKGHNVGPACAGSVVNQPTPDGQVYIDNSSAGPDPSNGDREVFTVVGPGGKTGTWTYQFAAAPSMPDTRIDGWELCDTACGQFGPPYGDSNMTVGSPASAANVIAAGSYVTRTCWQSIDGSTYCYTDPSTVVGGISRFSSRGPTRDGRVKPAVAAPGQGIASALSEDARPGVPPALIVGDDRHWILQGTSMASPHVAGAAALLLQLEPDTTYGQMETMLQALAVQDAFTGAVPNDTWGAGKLRVDLLDDSDGDGMNNLGEVSCGSPPRNAASRPERIDGAFAGVDDDADTLLDEALPPGSEGFDCDGDGFTGAAEGHVYSYKPETTGDQKTCQEYDSAFPDPAQTSAKPSLRWPSDFVTGGTPDSTDRINILDIVSFLAPIRYFNTDVGSHIADVRWDLAPGKGSPPLGTDINVYDLAALLAGATGFPPMLGGARAFNGPPCPWPP